MSLFTDYYKLVRLAENASLKTLRFDSIASTGSYELFEELAKRSKVKRLYCYLSPNTDGAVTANRKRMTDMKIHNKGHISSVYVPDLEYKHLAYGDIKNTSDALIIIFSEDGNTMEIFVARGSKNNVYAIYDRVKEGELDHELEELRKNSGKMLSL